MRFGLWAASFAAVALTLTGCSSAAVGEDASTPVDQAGMAAATALVEKYKAPVSEAVLPTTANPVEPGKFIVTVPCAYAAENCKRGVDAFAEAAASVGWRTQMIDPAGDPNAARAAIQQAINLKADGIFFMAGSPGGLATDLAEARQRGIVTVNVQGGGNEPGQFDVGIDPSPAGMGRLLAGQITVQSKGAAKVLLVNDPEFQAVAAIHDGLVAGLEEFCSSCTVTDDIDFQIADLSTGLPTQFESSLAAHPETNVVWASYDAAAASIRPVIQRSANGDTIKMVSTDGLEANLADVKSGGIQSADVAASSPWLAYQSLDYMNTLFNRGKAEPYIEAPYKLVTQDNVTSIPWDGDVDWKSAYLRQWK